MYPIRNYIRRSSVLVAVGLGLATNAAAQVAWDAPFMIPPRPPAGTGIYIADVAGGGFGVLVGWRSAALGRDLGWRVGIAEGHGSEELSGYAGFDVHGPIQRASKDAPFDVAWVAGGGLSVGDAAVLSIPLGVSMGRTLPGRRPVRLTPYFAPRITLDAVFDGNEGSDSLDLGFSVDLGVDLAFQSDWTARLAATIGDRDAVALGFVF
jgi:hypothetical protein